MKQQREALDLAESWADVIQYTRQAKALGGNWTCTLHMHGAEDIIVGEGWTREDAGWDALQKAGRLRSRIPTWPLTAAAMACAAFAGIEASYSFNPIQIIASVVAILTATRLIVERR